MGNFLKDRSATTESILCSGGCFVAQEIAQRVESQVALPRNDLRGARDTGTPFITFRISNLIRTPSPTRRSVVLQKMPVDMFAGNNPREKGIADSGGAVDDI